MNYLLAIALTFIAAFPTPDRVRTDITRADSLREVHYQRLLTGEIKPDFAAQLILSRIRGEITRDFKTSPESCGRTYIPMGNVHGVLDTLGSGRSYAEFVETILRKELDDSGWLLKEWNCDYEASKGWIYQWWVVPKAKD